MSDTPEHREQREQRDANAVLYREMSISLDAARMATRAEGDDRIPIAISSETPVLRYDWFEGERYNEVLDHSPESVDLSYARDGMPFLLEHDRGTQCGLVEDVTVDEDRKLRGFVRFSRSQCGQECKQDVVDGIRKKVSVGYRLSDEYTQTEGENGGIPTRRYTKWMPMECSSVSIPADYEVGVGRSAGGAAPRSSTPATPRHRTTAPAPEARSVTVSDQNTAAQNGAVTPAAEIAQLARAHGMTEKLPAWIEGARTVEQVRNEIMEHYRSAAAAAPKSIDSLDLPASEVKGRDYSVGRAVKAAFEGNWRGAAFELEVAQETVRQFGRGSAGGNGFAIPTVPLVRTSLSAGGSTTGSKTVFTQPGAFIEALVNKSIVLARPVLRLSGLQGNVALPRKSAKGSAGWYAELAGSDYTESNMQFDQVTLSPKTIADTQAYSKQMFVQSEVAIDQIVRSDLTENLALKFDADCMHASGSGNAITGLYSLSGLGSVPFGGTVTFPKIVDMETTAETANAALAGLAYVSTPEVRGKAKQTQKFSSTNGDPIWVGSVDDGEMNGYPAFASNQISKVLGAGTNEHGIVFGAWSQAIVADWGAIDITVDPYSRARQSLVNVTAVWLVDFNVRHAASFVKGTGLIP